MNKEKHLTTYLLFITLLSFIGCNETPSPGKTPVDYVNPYIGTISHLLAPTYPTIHLPNSMLRVHPMRGEVTDNKLNGLPVFLSGHRGGFAFSLNPFQGENVYSAPNIGYDYDNEVIKPYFYSVYLDNVATLVNFAPSCQSAIYEFDFKGDKEPSVMLSAIGGELSVKGNVVSGYQNLDKKKEARTYLHLEVEQTPDSSYSVTMDSNMSIVFKFSNKNRQLRVRYGISLISEEQAEKNMRREVSDCNVECLAEKGRMIWNNTLGKIKVQGEEKDKVIFYTALYRTYERMICISEDGNYYNGFDGKVHSDNGNPFYTDDWLWDTYRAVHPLRCIIEPEKETDMINSYIRMAEYGTNYWLPLFPKITGDTYQMNSNHGIATIIDGYRKGLTGFDLEKAYKAGKEAITGKTLAPWSKGEKSGILDTFFKEKGYFPALNPGEEETVPEINSWERRQPIAVSLGTYYDEWALSQVAKVLGKTDDYNDFLKRSLNYRILFNEKTKFFHPKNKEGFFIKPFDYRYSGGLGARDYYDENNGWIYRWDVQHNIADLIDLIGGREHFIDEMERMFNTPLGKPKYEFYAQLPDQTGNIGQFSIANEPSFHIPYLYNYAGQPWRTQKRIRNILDQWFRDDLMGMPGDEDGGGMSAFVVFSKLGFYPVTPGLPMYVIGSPAFENAEIQLLGGKSFRIKSLNYAPENKYIQSATLNGKKWDKSWFSHDELMQGGILEFTMGKYPQKTWASKIDDVPPSFEWSTNK